MLSSSRVNIGIKRMGELDEKSFKNACKQRYPPEEADIKALELCSLWQEKLKNPEWHPFRVVEDSKGNAQVTSNDFNQFLPIMVDILFHTISVTVLAIFRTFTSILCSTC